MFDSVLHAQLIEQQFFANFLIVGFNNTDTTFFVENIMRGKLTVLSSLNHSVKLIHIISKNNNIKKIYFNLE